MADGLQALGKTINESPTERSPSPSGIQLNSRGPREKAVKPS